MRKFDPSSRHNRRARLFQKIQNVFLPGNAGHSHWPLAILVSCVALSSLMVAPTVVHMLHPAYQGMPVELNAEDPLIWARVEESLSDRADKTDEPFIGDPVLSGTFSGTVEKYEGMVFRWTGWRAPTVLLLLDLIVPALIFLFLFLFFHTIGFTRSLSFVGSVVFSVLQIFTLNSPMSVRTSFVLILAAFIAIVLSIERGMYWILISGVLLGILVGLCFWSWSFAWAFWLVYLLWELLEWISFRLDEWGTKRKSLLLSLLRRIRKKIAKKRRKVFSPLEVLSMVGIIGVIAALPSLFGLADIMQHPFVRESLFRSGMHFSFAPESWPLTILFVIILAGFLGALIQDYDEFRSKKAVFVTVFAAFLYMHQQFLHGVTFQFVSQGMFYLSLAAISAILLSVQHRSQWLTISAGASVIFLLFVGVQNRFVFAQWFPGAGDLSAQHLRGALPALDALPRTLILSDPETLELVAGMTKHDIVYSVHLDTVLISSEEIAERFCLTQVPIAPEDRHTENIQELIHPDANAALRDDELRNAEVRLVLDACAHVDERAAYGLDWYGVNYILWDEKGHPEWQLSRFHAALEQAEKGDGWSLWKVL